MDLEWYPNTRAQGKFFKKSLAEEPGLALLRIALAHRMQIPIKDWSKPGHKSLVVVQEADQQTLVNPLASPTSVFLCSSQSDQL